MIRKRTHHALMASFLLSIFIVGCGGTSEGVPEVGEDFAAEQEKMMEQIEKEQEEQMRREQEMFQ